MAKFKVGDRILNIGTDIDQPNRGKVGTVISVTSIGTINIKYDDGSYGCCSQGGINYEIIKNSKSNNMSSLSLKDKFALAFKGEPEKSFIKAGVMNTDESLTQDGEALFLAFLLKKNGDAFKTEVVDPILAEEEKNADK